MSYRKRLNHWAVVRMLLNMQHIVMARFHRRSDADGYRVVVQRLMPDAVFIVVFDLGEQ